MNTRQGRVSLFCCYCVWECRFQTRLASRLQSPVHRRPYRGVCRTRFGGGLGRILR